MNINEIQDRCTQLLADAKKIPPETIHATTTFEELEVDSLDRVSLAFDVEEIYDIIIPESALATIRSVEEMALGIQKAIDAKTADITLRKNPA
jgi:acyl carrier protein